MRTPLPVGTHLTLSAIGTQQQITVQIQELIPDEAFDRLDALRQAQTQMLHWKEEIQSEMTEMKGKLTW